MHISFILTSLLLVSVNSFISCGQKKSSKDEEGIILIKEILSAFDEGARINAVMLKVLEPYQQDPKLTELINSYKHQYEAFKCCFKEYAETLKLMNTKSFGISQEEIEYYETIHKKTITINQKALMASNELIKKYLD